jgi:hypothetical protein
VALGSRRHGRGAEARLQGQSPEWQRSVHRRYLLIVVILTWQTVQAGRDRQSGIYSIGTVFLFQVFLEIFSDRSVACITQRTRSAVPAQEKHRRRAWHSHENLFYSNRKWNIFSKQPGNPLPGRR